MSVSWNNVVPDHGEATELNSESIGNFIVFTLFLLIYVLLFMKITNMLWVGTPLPQPIFIIFCLASLYCCYRYYYYYVFLMFQKHLIMAQDHINCMKNKKGGLASVT